MKDKDNTQRLREQYFFMMDHIEQLGIVLANCDSPQSVCFTLPTLSEDDLGDDPAIIPVQTLTGKHAIDVAIGHLSQHEIKEQVPGVFSPRLPGVISLTLTDKKCREVHQRINVINALKTDFALLVQSLSPSVDVRFEIVSQALPNLIKKAVARKILVAPEHCKRIGFSWKRFFSIRKKTPEQWDKYLENALKSKPKGCEQDKWEQSIAIERNIVRNNNDAAILISRRPIRITPAMNVVMQEGKVKATTIVAHSPLWVFNQNPTIGMLSDFGANKTKRKTVERDETLLISRLHLYR
ncbi:DNA replication terminus site-binding protein [Colwellia sp. MSW7]|uniref:DNA replication terminus site-binding protein n=1 Tax=Colwellia maritima TaxID=2912588 RepID=A0ABS9X733_9GAMM|nr:DNA replication terminus site-binding protein [Colwellia maritima]MCI2286019.1 DNA replication terminus site-binding protein [Colwellia maritima]